MPETLAGGTAVVLRAGTELGRAIAVEFAREGCSNIAIGDLDSVEFDETQRILQTQFKTLNLEVKSLDINEEASVASFFQRTVDRFGRIDFMANIANYEPPVAGAHETEESDFDAAFSNNQRWIFFASKQALGQMIKQDLLDGYETRGSIVNVTSIAGSAALLGMNAYSTSMAGVFGMSKSDAYDYAGDRIRVNVVSPLMLSNKEAAATLDEHPFNRHAAPEDVASAVAFLAGPKAAFISGIALPVDGGFHLRTGGPPRY